jgi:transcriptional regulator with XRE-family HTH domain
MDEMGYRERLGQVIAEVRALEHVTQQELAERIGRTPAAVSRWENGHTLPTAYDLRRISEALVMPPDLLLFPPAQQVSAVELALRQAVQAGQGKPGAHAPAPRQPRPPR